MKKYIVFSSTLAFAPVLVFAKDAEEILEIFGDVMGTAMPILISLAVLFFVYSLVRYLMKEGEEKADAKTHMVWGILILFVMVSVWGLVDIFSDTFDLEEGAPTVDWQVN